MTLAFTSRELAVLRGRLEYLRGDLEVRRNRALHDNEALEVYRSLLDACRALDVLDRAERRTLAALCG